MDVSIYNRSDKELLEWEFSLNGSDLRSHSWYHGNIPRASSELLLVDDGEFLVRDSSTFARSGDYVLSCNWKGVVLHFLIHKEVLQPNTIYEQLGYRFENESFTTVQDLITYYVGNKEPISAKSGAIISFPRTRAIPVSRKHRLMLPGEMGDNEYVSISHETILPADAVLIERSFTAESLYQVALNLKPPPGLFESLEEIPAKILMSSAYVSLTQARDDPPPRNSFDLSTFSSILLPSTSEDITMSSSLIHLLNSRIQEASDGTVAYHITQADWEVLQEDDTPEGSQDEDTSNRELKTNSGIYEKLLYNRSFRWRAVIERSLTFSHFVTTTISKAELRESMFNKWVGIANELKTGMGNFLSFCNIMRGLTCSKLNSPECSIDWLKLRRDYTDSAFLFETTLRNCYHHLLQGNEAYPPNTTIPNLLPGTVIVEELPELLPLLRTSSEEDKLKLTVAHMRQFYSFCNNEKIHTRNIHRIFEESNVTPDLILKDIFQTEVHLLLLWGQNYDNESIEFRCRQFE